MGIYGNGHGQYLRKLGKNNTPGVTKYRFTELHFDDYQFSF